MENFKHFLSLANILKAELCWGICILFATQLLPLEFELLKNVFLLS